MIGASTVKHLTASILAATGIAATFLAAPSATAADQRPCVSKVEFQSVSSVPKHELEARWEVAGLGRRGQVLGLDGTAWQITKYPRCGYSTDEAWYGVNYRHGVAFGVTSWRAASATPHGHP
jgi:hypothetical protein